VNVNERFQDSRELTLPMGDKANTIENVTLDHTAIVDVEGTEYYPLEEISAGPRYTRSSLHASGGMGHVWRARDSSIDREVALKELQTASPNSQRRFVREAKITGQLEHPGIVPVYELGRDAQSGHPFYVMRFVRGRTLTQVAKEFHQKCQTGKYDSMELVGLLTAFVSICNTIAYAHSHGIIHRDLKGENVIIGEFGEVIVLDWGLAKKLHELEETTTAEATEEPIAETEDTGKTLMGQLVGTPAYMAPEQAEGRLDLMGPWTDIYGLGAILYEILTGGAPFSGTTITAVLIQAIRGDVMPPRIYWSDVPPGLEEACLKALSKSPGDRFASAAEFGQEIQGWQDRQRRAAEDELRNAFDRMRLQQTALVELTRTETFGGSDLNAIFQQLVEVAARTLRVERVSIWSFTNNRQTMHCDALFELSDNRHSSGVELNACDYPNYFRAMCATDVIAATDAQTDPRTSEFTEGYLKPLGIGAMMEVPIHPNGVLCHEHIGPPREWLPDEQLFGIAVGHLAAHAISHWERQQALEQLANAEEK
jgi:serine/threonine protein kinase